jgi:hypothetical protein
MQDLTSINIQEYVPSIYKQPKTNKFRLHLINLSMYGLELRARLNDGNGVTPYLILGGGI